MAYALDHRQRFRPRVQYGGRTYRFPEVRSREEMRRVEREARETLRRGGTVQAISGLRVRHQFDLDAWNEAARSIPPERVLMLRVLERAVLDLSDAKLRVRQQARAWIQSDDRSWPFAFASVCEALGRDAESLRRKLLGDVLV